MTIMRDDFHDDDPFATDPDEDAAYAARQRRLDASYSREYQNWVDSLTPEDRRKLKEMGLESAYLPCGSGGATKDAAESSRARCEDELPEFEEVQANESPLHASVSDPEDIHDVLRRLIGELTDQNNSRLSLDCLALVTGLSYQGLSMTEIATRHGVTRAAVSKRCVELTIALRLKPSRAMRSLLARSSYRKARLQNLNAHP
jgi:hypothetical protein